MNKLYFLNRHYQLKATLKGRNQEIKRLKKTLRLNTKNYESSLEAHYEVEFYLRKELTETQKAIIESQRKKWYQFVELKK